MRAFSRTTGTRPLTDQARAADLDAEVARRRALAELRREQQREKDKVVRARRAARDAQRARRTAHRRDKRARRVARARLLAPLLVVNLLAVGGQVAYAYTEIPPAGWDTPMRLAVAVVFALAVESIALYVQWHAHDALILKAHATAFRLRRWSYLIAAVVGVLNYSHFAGEQLAPTPAAVAFGMVSLLSPWLWGLHTRREQHVQLVTEDRLDGGGATFSAERRRAFPIRSWQARRWSIDHNVSDPRAAWDGYNAERQAARRLQRAPVVEEPPNLDRQVALSRVLLLHAEVTELRRELRALAQVTPPWPEITGKATVSARVPVLADSSAPATRAAVARVPARSRRRGRDSVPESHDTGEVSVAERVASAARQDGVTKAVVAQRLGVSLRTVQRHWPSGTLDTT